MSSNDLDRSLVLDAVRVTEAAAIAAWQLVGTRRPPTRPPWTPCAPR
jgi:hypothetical protein